MSDKYLVYKDGVYEPKITVKDHEDIKVLVRNTRVAISPTQNVEDTPVVLLTEALATDLINSSLSSAGTVVGTIEVDAASEIQPLIDLFNAGGTLTFRSGTTYSRFEAQTADIVIFAPSPTSTLIAIEQALVDENIQMGLISNNAVFSQELERVEAKVDSNETSINTNTSNITSIQNNKQDKTDPFLNTVDKTVTGSINETLTRVNTNAGLIQDNTAAIANLDASNKQDVTDTGLNTTDKTIVGAINEVKLEKDNLQTTVGINSSNISSNSTAISANSDAIATKVGGTFGTMDPSYNPASAKDVATFDTVLDLSSNLINSIVGGPLNSGNYDTLESAKLRDDTQDNRIAALENLISGNEDLEVVESLLTWEGRVAPNAGGTSTSITFTMPSNANQISNGAAFDYSTKKLFVIGLADTIAKTAVSVVVDANDASNFFFQDENFGVEARLNSDGTMSVIRNTGSNDLFDDIRLVYVAELTSVGIANLVKLQDFIDEQNRVNAAIALKQDSTDTGLLTADNTIVGAINETNALAQQNKADIDAIDLDALGVDLKQDIQDSNLETVADEIVPAINEVNAKTNANDSAISVIRDELDAIDIDSKQDSIDNGLNTPSKSIVGAINEVHAGVSANGNLITGLRSDVDQNTSELAGVDAKIDDAKSFGFTGATNDEITDLNEQRTRTLKAETNISSSEMKFSTLNDTVQDNIQARLDLKAGSATGAIILDKSDRLKLVDGTDEVSVETLTKLNNTVVATFEFDDGTTENYELLEV